VPAVVSDDDDDDGDNDGDDEDVVVDGTAAGRTVSHVLVITTFLYLPSSHRLHAAEPHCDDADIDQLNRVAHDPCDPDPDPDPDPNPDPNPNPDPSSTIPNAPLSMIDGCEENPILLSWPWLDV
jgi:hypothetical protein